MKIKRKFMAGFLALLLLSSQLVLPCSALANNSQSTNQPITKSKDEPKKNAKENFVTTLAKDKDSLKNGLKTEPSDKKLNSSNSPLKIKPLKELKSQDRASSSDTKKWKHVKMNELPKEVKMDLTSQYRHIMEDGKVVSILEGYKIKLSGLKPYSQCILRAKGDGNYPITMTANEDGDIYEFLSSSMGKSFGFEGVAFFEGDIEDTTPAEEEMVTFDLVVMSDEKVGGIFIEVYDENDNIIGSGKTNRKGNRLFNLKLPLRKQKLKIKQIAGKSPSGIKYDTEKILEIDPENQRNYSVFFENTRVGRQITVTNQVAEINKPDKPFSYKLVFMNQDEYMWEQPFTLKAGESFTYEEPEPGTRYRLEQISAPPGYTLENIENGRGYTDNQDIHIVAHNKYKATGTFTPKMIVKDQVSADVKVDAYLEQDNGNKEVKGLDTTKKQMVVTFSPIHYSLKDIGKHTYKMGIVFPSPFDPPNYFASVMASADGTIEVEVTDNGDGTLKVTQLTPPVEVIIDFKNVQLPITGTNEIALVMFTLITGTLITFKVTRRKTT